MDEADSVEGVGERASLSASPADVHDFDGAEWRETGIIENPSPIRRVKDNGLMYDKRNKVCYLRHWLCRVEHVAR